MIVDKIDWTGCPITERDPEKMGGVSTLRGERISADNIIENIEDGASFDEMIENFHLSIEDMKTLIAYAGQARQRANSVR